jgi:hypothetical protein
VVEICSENCTTPDLDLVSNAHHVEAVGGWYRSVDHTNRPPGFSKSTAARKHERTRSNEYSSLSGNLTP